MVADTRKRVAFLVVGYKPVCCCIACQNYNSVSPATVLNANLAHMVQLVLRVHFISN